MNGGGTGIRTLDTLAGIPTFQAGALDRYAIPPDLYPLFILYFKIIKIGQKKKVKIALVKNCSE